MLRYLAGRLLRALLTIFLVVTFAFFVLRLSGDPALLILSVDAPPEVDRGLPHRRGASTGRSGSSTSPISATP